MAATNQNEVARAVLSDWPKPRRTEPLQKAFTATHYEMRSVEIRSDEMRGEK